MSDVDQVKPATSFPAIFSPEQSDDELRSAVVAQTGLSCHDLALRFESFGDDCEFGFVQRRCGVEPLGMFRFSSARHDVVLKFVESNFEQFGQNTVIELDEQVPRREWTVIDKANGLREHTFIFEGDQPEETIYASQKKRLDFLKRIMIENISIGNKIYVIKSAKGNLSYDIVLAIAVALRKRGNNWLLWVEPGLDVGRIDVLTEGLMRGTIDRFSVVGHIGLFSFSGWLAVLSSAWRVAVQRGM